MTDEPMADEPRSDEPRSDEPRRRRPMRRIGDLMPDAAARLGLEAELRRARFLATFDAVVAELAPAAHGACRAVRVDDETLLVEADAPIVGQELLLRAEELVAAFRRAPAGAPVRQLRVTIRRR
jgi:Dna[CI] antecedent DciA-like protein